MQPQRSIPIDTKDRERTYHAREPIPPELVERIGALRGVECVEQYRRYGLVVQIGGAFDWDADGIDAAVMAELNFLVAGAEVKQ